LCGIRFHDKRCIFTVIDFDIILRYVKKKAKDPVTHDRIYI